MERTDSFGYWVKRRRKALDLTQRALADEVGCATVTIKKIEADERRPSRQMAERLAECLAIPPDQREDFILSARGKRAIHRTPLTSQPVDPGATLDQAGLGQLSSAEAPQRMPAALGQIVRGRMVGRQRELEAAMRQLKLAMTGESSALTINGEPGVGKTRLAHEIIERARLSGAAVLAGGCYEYEAATPYLPISEALNDWVNRQEPAVLKAQLGEIAPELVRLAPEIEFKIGKQEALPPLSPQEDRLRLLDYVSRFFNYLANEFGLVLFIDDLHWSDQGTHALLSYLLRRLRKERLLILATYREMELNRSHPLSALLVEWNRERRAVRIDLQRLSLAETNMLLASMFGQESVSDDFAGTIHRETEGNPFYIEEVVKSLIDHGQIYRVGERWERLEITELTIPGSIQEAIGRRLSRLSPACLDMLQTAAILGKNFQFQELSAVSKIPDGELLNVLDEAVTAQLISVKSDESIVFTHDKIREALYAEINPIRRRRFHQSIGEALESLYAQNLEAKIQDLAYHFTHSGDLNKGLDYSRRAAEKAYGLFANEEALGYYEDAHACAEKLHRRATITAIEEEMANILAQKGLFTTAVEYYQRALDGASDPGKQAALTAKIGMVYAESGDPRGRELLQSALDELDPKTQPLELALATMALGRFLHYRALYSQALELYERALRITEPLDDPWTLAHIFGFIAGAYQHMTRFDQSMQWAHRAIAYGEEKDYPFAIAVGYEFIAENHTIMGNWRDALEAADHDFKLGKKIGSQNRMTWAGFSRGDAYYGQGKLNQALIIIQDVIESSEGMGDWRLAILAGTYLSNVETDLGNDERARTQAERWITQADKSGELQLQARSRLALGYLHVQRQEWTQAHDYLEEIDQMIRKTEEKSMLLVTQAFHAEACWGIGDYVKAEEIANSALSHARQAGAPHWEALTLRVLGQIHTFSDKEPQAEEEIDRAIELFEEIGSQLELGRALSARGDLYTSQGDTEAAKTDYKRAIDIFKAVGAPRDLERARNRHENFPE